MLVHPVPLHGRDAAVCGAHLRQTSRYRRFLYEGYIQLVVTLPQSIQLGSFEAFRWEDGARLMIRGTDAQLARVKCVVQSITDVEASIGVRLLPRLQWSQDTLITQ
jgi:hypothetical protein